MKISVEPPQNLVKKHGGFNRLDALLGRPDAKMQVFLHLRDATAMLH